VLLLFLALLRGQDFGGVTGPVHLGVCICHLDVNNNQSLNVEGMTLSHCPFFFSRRIVLHASQSKSARIEDRVESSFSVQWDLSSAVTAFQTDWW
jgi:hypothetical protein